jgi:hypothetical protein
MPSACAERPPAGAAFWRLLRGSGSTLEATIAGRSMLPTLRDGDRVRLRPVAAADYRDGDVVVCVLKDELFAHRVVHRCGRGADDCVVTLGDGRRLCDPATRVSDILGRVEATWREETWVALPDPPPRGAAARAAIGFNCHLLAACLRLHYGLARRLQGTLLWGARLPHLLAQRR